MMTNEEPAAGHSDSKLLVLCGVQHAFDFDFLRQCRKKIQLVQKTIAQNRIREYLDEVPDCILIFAPVITQSLLDFLSELRLRMINPILLFGNIPAPEQMLAAYQAGADEVIGLPISEELVCAKVRAWLRRAWTISVEAIDDLAVKDCLLKVSERVLMVGDRPPLALTNLELRLLHLLMRHSPRAISAEELIERVWGYYSEADRGALKNAIYRLRRKIELDPAHPRYLLTVSGLGYAFAGDPPPRG